MLQPKIIIQVLKQLQQEIHENSNVKGFWSDHDKLQKLADDAGMGDVARHCIECTKIALHHSELTEAMDGIRAGNTQDDKIPEFLSVEAELADCVIRIMDHAEKYGYRLADAIITKVKFNESRSYRHGGKRF